MAPVFKLNKIIIAPKVRKSNISVILFLCIIILKTQTAFMMPYYRESFSEVVSLITFSSHGIDQFELLSIIVILSLLEYLSEVLLEIIELQNLFVNSLSSYFKLFQKFNFAFNIFMFSLSVLFDFYAVTIFLIKCDLLSLITFF